MAGPSDEHKKELSFASQVQAFDFCGESIDASLRKLLARVLLPKEAQQIDRAMEDFAKRYHECNPGLVDHPDVVYAVAFSILLLHTDAHNKNVKQKMNKDTFIMRTKVIEGGEGFPHEILDIIYDNIIMSEFTYADSQTTLKNSSWFSKLKSSSSVDLTHHHTQSNALLMDLSQKLEQLMPAENSFRYKRTLKPIPMMEIHLSLLKAKSLCLAGVKSKHDSSTSTHNTFTIRVTKAGILDRKYDLIQGGKKATARGWRPFGVILSGSQIIFFGDVSSYQQWLEEEPMSPMSIHSTSELISKRNHSFPVLAESIPTSSYLRPVQIVSLSYAVCICDEQYTKYPHVFRLITGDGQQFLMRAQNDQEMDDWILKINYAATLKTTGVRMRPLKRQIDSERSKREERAKEKVQELSDRIDEQVKLLDRELQLRRNLMVIVPYQKSTKDRILAFAETVGKRIKIKRIELQRLECYRDYLEAELNWHPSASQQQQRKMSLPLPSHLCSLVSLPTAKKLSHLAFEEEEEEEEEENEEKKAEEDNLPVKVEDKKDLDRVMRRRSQSNPVRPMDKKLLLLEPPKPHGRQRSGSEASSVGGDDDNMSVIIVNDSEELLTESWPPAE